MELGLIPSKTLDMEIKPDVFAASVACRLGVDVMEDGNQCPFCGLFLDSRGIHCGSCTAGGNTTVRHNAIRECLADVLRTDSLRRPADVLVVPALVLARRLLDG